MSNEPLSIHGDDPALLREAVRRAVDFRGDVTIELRSGGTVSGYAFDAALANSANAASGLNPGDEIRVLPADSNDRCRVALRDIRTLAFTGKDAASGKTWDNWVRRYAAKELAGEAASIESETDEISAATP